MRTPINDGDVGVACNWTRVQGTAPCGGGSTATVKRRCLKGHGQRRCVDILLIQPLR